MEREAGKGGTKGGQKGRKARTEGRTTGEEGEEGMIKSISPNYN